MSTDLLTALFQAACNATAAAKEHALDWDACRYRQSADFFWQLFLDEADEYRKRYNPASVTAGHPDYDDLGEDMFILTGATKSELR